MWANLLFVKGNSCEGGGEGSRRKNAANVEVAWHFYAHRELSASAADGKWQPQSNCDRQRRKIQSVTCKRDSAEDTFTRRARPTSSDLPRSHICSSRHLLELRLGKTWQREAAGLVFPAFLSGWRGSDGEDFAHYVLVAGSRCIWTMSLWPWWSQPNWCRDSKWNMEGGACLDLPTQTSRCSEWAVCEGGRGEQCTQGTWIRGSDKDESEGTEQITAFIVSLARGFTLI